MKRAAVIAACACALALSACSAAPIDVAGLPGDSLFDGLLAHFSMDEGAGTVVGDQSGNRRDGTLIGATWTEGRFRTALHFIPGDQASVPAFPDATASWTVSTWVRIDTAELGAEYETLVSTEVPFKGGWEVNVIFTPGPPRYHFGYYVGPNQSDYDFVECNCFAPDRWVHVAATVDGAAGRLALYVDGVRAQQVPIRAAITPGSPVLFFGTWSDPSAPRPFTGALDDVAIWSRALVPEEIARLASNPAPIAP